MGTSYDILLVVFLAGGLGVGAWRGLAVQLAGIASLVLGYLVAFPATKAIVATLEEPPPLHGFVIFLACYAVTSGACYFVAGRQRKRLEEKKVEGWDRQLGAILGVCHALLLFLILSITAVVIAPSLRAPILERPAGQAMQTLYQAFYHALPAEAQEALQPVVDRARSE